MNDWPKYLIEFLGTMFWALFLGLSVGSGSPLWPLGVSLGLVGLVYASHVHSGAHFNPAYTLAVLTLRRMSWQEAGLYVLAQLLGGLAGAGLTILLVQDDAFAFEIIPAGSATLAQVLTSELIFSFLFVLVSLIVLLSQSQSGNGYYGLAVGGSYLAIILAAKEISGPGINPALAFGADLISANYESLWYYFVGPLAGGSLAGLVLRFIAPEDAYPGPKRRKQIKEEILKDMEQEENDLEVISDPHDDHPDR